MRFSFTCLFMFNLVFSTSNVQAQYSSLAYTQTTHLNDTIYTQSYLYKQAKQWILESFKGLSQQEIREYADFGEISFVGKMPYKSRVFDGAENSSGQIIYVTVIRVKDGKYTLELKQFRHQGTITKGHGAYSFGMITNDSLCHEEIAKAPGERWKQKVWKDIHVQIDEQVTLMRASLKRKMEEKVE